MRPLSAAIEAALGLAVSYACLWASALPGLPVWAPSMLVTASFALVPTVLVLVHRLEPHDLGLRIGRVGYGKLALILALLCLVTLPIHRAGLLTLKLAGNDPRRLLDGLRALGDLWGRLKPGLPADFWQEVPTQFVSVALPEELFYRGYLQPRLDLLTEKLGGRRWRVFGADVGLGLPLASAAFALAHVVALWDPRRLSVFFPSLIFGWLRARTGSLWASVLYHAVCNLWLTIAVETWVRSR